MLQNDHCGFATFLRDIESSSTSEEGGIMETTRIKLFMKYVGIEYEVLAKGIHRDDTYGIYVG